MLIKQILTVCVCVCVCLENKGLIHLNDFSLSGDIQNSAVI